MSKKKKNGWENTICTKKIVHTEMTEDFSGKQFILKKKSF